MAGRTITEDLRGEDGVAREHHAATFLVHLAEGSTVVPSKFDAQLFEESADEHVRKNRESLHAFKEKFAPARGGSDPVKG